MRRGVTLIELLFVFAILVILAAACYGAFAEAVAQAKVSRTRAQIGKINQLIMAKWESYRTRAVPIKVPAGVRPIGEPFVDTAADDNLTNGMFDAGESFTDQNGNMQYDMGAADYRLYSLRELMRLELPSIKADVTVDPLFIARPSLSKNYARRAASINGGIAAWSQQFEGAECLYMILAAMRDGEDSGLDFFKPEEIGDYDGDGMNEIHDAWGQPIEFVRWPAGYSESQGIDQQWGVAGVDDDQNLIVDDSAEAGWKGSDDVLPPPTMQTRNYEKAPDPFDPMGADGRTRLPNLFIVPFALTPLVYSAGPDKEYDVRVLTASNAKELLDPYRVAFSQGRLSSGSPFDPDGAAGFADNITNHDFGEK